MHRYGRFTSLTATALLVVFAGLAGGAARAATDDHSPGKMHLLWKSDAGKDRLEVDPLDLAIGESRELTTDNGELVTLTRTENGYTLEKDGETIELGTGKLEIAPGEHFRMHKIEFGGEGDANTFVLSDEGCDEPCPTKHRLRRIELDGNGDAKTFVISDGNPHVLRFRNEDGGNGFAYRVGPGPLPLLPFDDLMARIEKSEKFLALDDTTREIVREVVRDAAPKMDNLEWIGADDDEAGENLDLVIEH